MTQSSTRVRTLPYPAVEEGNLSFPDAEYTAGPADNFELFGAKITIRHKLIGAPLIEELIRKRLVKFGCVVAVPKSGYRRLYKSDSPEQEISWEPGQVSEPPMFGPVLLYIGKNRKLKLEAKHGVSPFWQGKEAEIPCGARLARAKYLRPTASIVKMMNVRLKKDMEKGNFTVVPNSNGGFSFNLDAAVDVYVFLQNPLGCSELRGSILTHAVCQCLNILRNDYRNQEEWSEFSNLRSLSGLLEKKGQLHWGDENFDPMAAATSLYPVKIPEQSIEE